jgi:hypothetical protein
MIIKEFLVGLGFEVDEASLKKFNDGIKSATLRVTALYASVKAATAGIVKAISSVSSNFETLGYEMRILAPSINRVLALRREMLRAYSAAGVNLGKVLQQSIRLNFSLAKTRYAFEAIYKSVAAKFFPLITRQSDLLREKLYRNMPKIQSALEKFVLVVFKAFEATVALGSRVWSILTRVYDFFVQLDRATDGWSTKIIAAVAAWKLLNLSFLATPLGMILTGLLAIIALYDDFKTFTEGGKALLNWSSFIPVANAIARAVGSITASMVGLFKIVVDLVSAIWKLLHLDFSGFASKMGSAFERLLPLFKNLWDLIRGVAVVSSELGNWLAGFFNGNQNVASNVQNNPVNRQVANPVGNNVQNSQTNQNVRQQTTINVQGSSDATATGKAVAAEQSRVNFNLVRNLSGATR